MLFVGTRKTNVWAESNRILHFPAAEYFDEGSDVAVGVVVPEGKLIPVEEQSFNHTGRQDRAV